MKLSLQNGAVMATLPQAKAKARALAKYIEYFGHEKPRCEDKKYIDALRFGGAVTVDLLVQFNISLHQHLDEVGRHLTKNRQDILKAESHVKDVFEIDQFAGVMADEIVKRQAATHNQEISMALTAANYCEWMKAQKLQTVGACGIIANSLLDPEQYENLSCVIENLEFQGILPKGSHRKLSQMSQFSQHAYALKVISELGQPQLADELLRVKGVAV